MLIITGSGRSGTSVITEFLYLCNFEVVTTSKKMDADKRGGFNSHSLFNAASKKRKIKYNKKQIVKSPKFMNYGTCDMWGKLAETCGSGLNVLICHRDFREAANSFKKYGMGYPLGKNNLKSVEQIEQEIKENYELTIEYLDHWKINYQIITFPDYLFDFENVKSILETLSVKLPDNAKEIWDKLVDLGAYK